LQHFLRQLRVQSALFVAAKGFGGTTPQ
jgi:hypothetical protein